MINIRIRRCFIFLMLFTFLYGCAAGSIVTYTELSQQLKKGLQTLNGPMLEHLIVIIDESKTKQEIDEKTERLYITTLLSLGYSDRAIQSLEHFTFKDLWEPFLAIGIIYETRGYKEKANLYYSQTVDTIQKERSHTKKDNIALIYTLFLLNREDELESTSLDNNNDTKKDILAAKEAFKIYSREEILYANPLGYIIQQRVFK